MIEGLVHRAFVQGGAAMTLCLLHKRLPRKKKIEEPTLLASGLQFKFTSREFFLDVNSLPTVKPGIYYIPKKKNQPTIDSFIIVHRDFVTKNFPNEASRSKAEYFILFFQVTISRDHVVDGDELNKVKNAAKDKIQIVKGETQQLGVPELPMIFLFVTEPGGIKTWQGLTKLVANEEAKASARAASAPGTKPEKIARIRVPYDEDKHELKNQYACYMLQKEFMEVKTLWREPESEQ